VYEGKDNISRRAHGDWGRELRGCGPESACCQGGREKKNNFREEGEMPAPEKGRGLRNHSQVKGKAIVMGSSRVRRKNIYGRIRAFSKTGE